MCLPQGMRERRLPEETGAFSRGQEGKSRADGRGWRPSDALPAVLALRLRLTWGCVAASPCAAAGAGLVAESCPALVTPRTVARQASLSMELSRQKYWSRWPFPSPGDAPDPRTEAASPALQTVPCIASRFFIYHWAARAAQAGEKNEWGCALSSEGACSVDGAPSGSWRYTVPGNLSPGKASLPEASRVGSVARWSISESKSELLGKPPDTWGWHLFCGQGWHQLDDVPVATWQLPCICKWVRNPGHPGESLWGSFLGEHLIYVPKNVLHAKGCHTVTNKMFIPTQCFSSAHHRNAE